MYRLHPSWVAVRDLVASGPDRPAGRGRHLVLVLQRRPGQHPQHPGRRRRRPVRHRLLRGQPVADAVRRASRRASRRPSRATRRAASTSSPAASSSSPSGVATFTCSTRMEPDQRVDIYGTEGRIRIPIPFNIPPDRPDPGARRRGRRTARAPGRRGARVPDAGPVRGRRPRGSRARSSTADPSPRRPRTRSPTSRSSRHCSPPRTPLSGAVPFRRAGPSPGRAMEEVWHDRSACWHVPRSAAPPPDGAGRRRDRPGRRRGGRRGPRRHAAVGVGTDLPARRGAPRVVRRATLGRGAARRDPPRAAEPARPRPQPVPHLGRDVGCLGGLRPDGRGYLVTEKRAAGDVAAARNEAISYAAYRVLSARFIKAVGGAESLSEFADVMDSLCYPLDVTTTEGDTPAAVGNRIAAAVLALRPRPTAPTRPRATPLPTTSR